MIKFWSVYICFIIFTTVFVTLINDALGFGMDAWWFWELFWLAFSGIVSFVIAGTDTPNDPEQDSDAEKNW